MNAKLEFAPLLTADAVARYLHVHPRTLSRLAQGGDDTFPKPLHVGRSLRWRADQILAWMGGQS